MLDKEVKRGSTEMLILALVEDRPRHGYEIAKLIEERSDGVLQFHPASLYPLLYRMEKRGLIKGTWIEKAGQRRRRGWIARRAIDIGPHAGVLPMAVAIIRDVPVHRPVLAIAIPVEPLANVDDAAIAVEQIGIVIIAYPALARPRRGEAVELPIADRELRREEEGRGAISWRPPKGWAAIGFSHRRRAAAVRSVAAYSRRSRFRATNP